MVGINDNDVLDRIIENLVFPSNDLTGDNASEPKLDNVIFGEAPNDKKLSKAGNTAYIRTSEKTLVSSVRLGTDKGRKVKLETREYWIEIVTKMINTISDSIRVSNTLTFKIKEIIEKNRHLTKTDNTLPMSVDVTVFDVPRDVTTIGRGRQSNTVIIRYDFVVE